ncbi:MAG: PPOX class F420-dependent oxidoreductase [Actinomycetota bacterium]|nr:PPOX class F420-dependent oxidoreductase [Actinomycetota bacterium]
MLSDAQVAYLSSQILGRLATLGPDGPQVRPVGFSFDADTGVIEIGGYSLPSTQKWKNVRDDPRVAFVVDDLASTDPWRPRALEVRGTAEAVAVADGADRDVIRISPDRILTMGLEQ